MVISGTSKIRHWGIEDPTMKQLLEERGLTEIPLYRLDSPKIKHANWLSSVDWWTKMAAERDGPVNSSKIDTSDITQVSSDIKKLAMELGASDVGFAKLTPTMLKEGCTRSTPNIISLIIEEEYHHALEGAIGIEKEAVRVYEECATLATELAKRIREMGFSAIADHNGTMEIQAIPAMYACGLGELGKHGSLIHRELGARFRPSFVTTDLPLALDEPDIFGVQDFCARCNVCTRNCPPDAIPASEDFTITEGVKRWRTDIEACYHASRLREEYCHICVDVCPYNIKTTSNEAIKPIYLTYMSKRRAAGNRAPTWFIEDEEKVMANGPVTEILRM
jgi:ferredoxin